MSPCRWWQWHGARCTARSAAAGTWRQKGLLKGVRSISNHHLDPIKPASASPLPSQTYQQDVDVSSDAAPVLQDFLHPSQQHAEDGLLDELVPMDAGRQGPRQLVKDILGQKRQSTARKTRCSK